MTANDHPTAHHPTKSKFHSPSCASLSQVPGAGDSAAPPALDRPLSPGSAAPSATLETVNELSGFKLTCAADDCRAGPEDGTLRTVGGERWFVCRNGHLNAELVDDFREAA